MTTRNYDQSGIGSNVELGKRGPRIVDNSGAIEHKNQADNAYAIVRGAHPVAENDFVTKRYLETRSGASVTGQIDGGTPPTAGTAGRLWICTTTGGTFTVNYLYYDNGVSWDEIIPSEGMSISVTDALTGGAVEFLADHVYLWDLDSTTWKDIGPGAAETKLVKAVSIALAYTNIGTNLLATVPANAVVTKIVVNVTQAWGSPLPSLIVGDAGDTNRLAEDKDIDLNKVGIYAVTQLHLYSVETPVNAILANNTATPATGAARVYIEYALP
jgi:hypothetical protein